MKKKKLLIALGLNILILTIPVAFFAGRFVQDRREFHLRYEKEKEVMEKVIADMNLKGVFVKQLSQGGITLGGSVQSEEIKDELIKRFFDQLNYRQESFFMEDLRIEPKEN